MLKSVVAAVVLVAFAYAANAQDARAKLSPSQIREEQVYTAGVQTAIWGRPFVDLVHTLYAGLEVNGVGLN
ncbi:hypothetical protein [Bosea sp. Root483D1]|uniref:hypothetical protein n=1 Tax=Bosea sp. Root483D1 TaxID=1736544 RepID=UPI00070FBC8B|nr:hypothetical protein [Bosea sp. Root483D1]